MTREARGGKGCSLWGQDVAQDLVALAEDETSQSSSPGLERGRVWGGGRACGLASRCCGAANPRVTCDRDSQRRRRRFVSYVVDDSLGFVHTTSGVSSVVGSCS